MSPVCGVAGSEGSSLLKLAIFRYLRMIWPYCYRIDSFSIRSHQCVCVCSVLIFDVVLDMVTNYWYVPCDFSALIHVYIPSSKEICCFTCPKLSGKNWKKSLFQQLRPLPKHTTQHNSTFVLSFSRCGQEWQKYDKTNKLPLAPGTARIKDLKSTKNPTTVENSKPVGIQINSKFFTWKKKTQLRRR